MNRYQFDVAAITFECQIPEGVDIQKFLFSYKPFQRTVLLSHPGMIVKPLSFSPDLNKMVCFETFSNDLGDVSAYSSDDGYAFTFEYSDSGDKYCMVTDKLFSNIEYSIDWNTIYAGTALTSMIRTAFAQRILLYGGFMIHSSVIKNDNKGFLFLGKSGTGKSTHSRLWLKYIPGTSLLNDDNPICRFVGDKLFVFGSPWSGKSPCYQNDSVEVASFVRLEQAPINEFSVKQGIFAWTEVYPSCSFLKQSEVFYQTFVDLLNKVVLTSIIGHLKCLPNQDAAIICYKNVRQLIENK